MNTNDKSLKNVFHPAKPPSESESLDLEAVLAECVEALEERFERLNENGGYPQILASTRAALAVVERWAKIPIEVKSTPLEFNVIAGQGVSTYSGTSLEPLPANAYDRDYTENKGMVHLAISLECRRRNEARP